MLPVMAMLSFLIPWAVVQIQIWVLSAGFDLPPENGSKLNESL